MKKILLAEENISHIEFVEGIKSKKIKIEYNFEDLDVYAICSGNDKTILGLIHGISLFIIPLLIIIYSIIINNYWLLIGIIISYIATVLTYKSGYKISIFLLLFLIGNWLRVGFHFQNLFTFYSLTFIISQLKEMIVKEYDNIFLVNTLVKDSSSFYEIQDKIAIVNQSS